MMQEGLLWYLVREKKRILTDERAKSVFFVEETAFVPKNQ